MILGIESTAHTFGIGVVNSGKILANVRDAYTTESGGIVPMEAAAHHRKISNEVLDKALKEGNISKDKVTAIAFSQGPGLAPCLIEGMKFAKSLAKDLKVPLVPVNHCVAHLEIGKITGARDPVLLYASGANTQVIAYAGGKYRVFGETLDNGIGNFIDGFARYIGLGFPGGPKIQMLAEGKSFSSQLPPPTRKFAHNNSTHNPDHQPQLVSQTSSPTLDKFSKLDNKDDQITVRKYIELPYVIKGMDVSFSGMQTKLKQLYDKKENVNDLAFSLQETAFAMLVEAAERAMAHVGKNELVLGGGVGCNTRLKEMCEIMCKERNAKFFVPSNDLLVDNGAMIAYLGEIMFKKGIIIDVEKTDVLPRQRTDDVIVKWK